jgi:hypothetical protein
MTASSVNDHRESWQEESERNGDQFALLVGAFLRVIVGGVKIVPPAVAQGRYYRPCKAAGGIRSECHYCNRGCVQVFK